MTKFLCKPYTRSSAARGLTRFIGILAILGGNGIHLISKYFAQF